MKVGFLTDQGLVRGSNQDNILVDEKLGLLIVADGMGGHNAGEVASAIAVREASRVVAEGLALQDDTLAVMQKAIICAHEAIRNKSEELPELDGMGTTVVMALLNDNYFLIGHVGDSRAYAISDQCITRLTCDHSFVAEWLRDGMITQEEARTHAARHGLTMALGVDDVEPVLVCLPWEEDEYLLLCSDGLTDMLEDEQVLRIVNRSAGLQQACEDLVASAKQKGGRDNISVILVSH